MASLTLVEERFHEGSTTIRVYHRYEGGWGFQSTNLDGAPYSEAARDYEEIGTIEIPETDIWLDGCDFPDYSGAIRKNIARLQGVADLYIRGTQSRLILKPYELIRDYSLCVDVSKSK